MIIIDSSNHPVEIKLVELSFWSLRDEVQHYYREKVKELGEEKKKEIIKELDKEYTHTGTPPGDKKDAPAEGEKPKEEGKEEEKEEEKSEEGEKAEGAEGDEKTEEDSGDAANETLENVMAKNPKLKVIPPIDKDKIVKGFLFLSDINMTDLSFFSPVPFKIGQYIFLDLNISNSFIVSADIVDCKKISLGGRIIRERKGEFRIKAKLLFLRKGERTLLRNLVKSIEPEIPPPPKKKAPPKEDDGGLGDFEF